MTRFRQNWPAGIQQLRLQPPAMIHHPNHPSIRDPHQIKPLPPSSKLVSSMLSWSRFTAFCSFFFFFFDVAQLLINIVASCARCFVYLYVGVTLVPGYFYPYLCVIFHSLTHWPVSLSCSFSLYALTVTFCRHIARQLSKISI